MDKDKMKVWVEMLKCNPDDPCAYDNTCNNHRTLQNALVDLESDHLAALEVEVKEKDKKIVALNAENKRLFEEGIAIMHDQGAENILLKEQIATLTTATSG